MKKVVLLDTVKVVSEVSELSHSLAETGDHNWRPCHGHRKNTEPDPKATKSPLTATATSAFMAGKESFIVVGMGKLAWI